MSIYTILFLDFFSGEHFFPNLTNLSTTLVLILCRLNVKKCHPCIRFDFVWNRPILKRFHFEERDSFQ